MKKLKTENDFLFSPDYSEAFDTTDFEISLSLMRRVGVPEPVVRTLKKAWTAQKRWVTYGGNVHPEVITNILALLQGDCWSPLALSLVLTPFRKISQMCPDVLQVLYMDDRSASFRTLDDYVDSGHR